MAQWSELTVMGVPGKTFKITTGTGDAGKDEVDTVPTQPRAVEREVTLFSGTYATGATYYAMMELDADVTDLKLYALTNDADGPLTFDTKITETLPSTQFYASSSLVDWTPTQNTREMHSITNLGGVRFLRVGYENNSGGTVTLSVVARYVTYLDEARLLLTGDV